MFLKKRFVPYLICILNLNKKEKSKYTYTHTHSFMESKNEIKARYNKTQNICGECVFWVSFLIFSLCPTGVTLIPVPVERASFHPQRLGSHLDMFMSQRPDTAGDRLLLPQSPWGYLFQCQLLFEDLLLLWETDSAKAFI